MEDVFKNGKEAEYPNKKQIYDLALRNKLDDATPEAERLLHEKLFDNYWNVLLPKVAGHSAWGPTKRHYCLLSSGKVDDEDPESELLVTPSDEAFLCVLWENCYTKWWYREQCNRKTPNEEPKEDHKDMQTPFTDAKGGQKKYGGWNAEGINRYDRLCAEITKNRTDLKQYIEDVEKGALERIQEANDVTDKDANKKKKKKKRKSAGIFEEETDDENDYSAW